jgi:(1->4)-alpha-D-glucan 1-alpha-D-glucosylmutase
LADATALLDYLADLGAGAVYLSPLLRSTTGSAHGYDTVDVGEIDPDRGGEEGLQALFAGAADAGTGRRHRHRPQPPRGRGAGREPRLVGRPAARPRVRHASWFDIDWERPRLLLPVLGDDAVLSVQDGELRYYDHRFPLAPGSWSEGEDAETVHARQHYELVHWSRGNTDLGYRRFFAVTTLAGVRQEDRAVFDATHVKVAEWVERGVSGPAHRPPRRPGRPRGVPAPAARAGPRPVDHRGEDPRARGAAAGGLAGRGHHRATTPCAR